MTVLKVTYEAVRMNISSRQKDLMELFVLVEITRHFLHIDAV